MCRDEIKSKILKVIEVEILKSKLPQMQGDENLGEDGMGIDSLNFLKLLTALEKEFNMKIEDDYWDYHRLKTLNLLIDYFLII